MATTSSEILQPVSAYRAETIANHFIEMAEKKGESLTQMKLQKLVFYAHGWHLAIRDKPLIDESIEAWRYGPVIRSLYNSFKHFRNDPVSVVSNADFDCFDDNGHVPSIDETGNLDHMFTKLLLEAIWNKLGGLDAIQLSNLTHKPGTPWSDTVAKYSGQLPRGIDIDDDLIKKYFKEHAV